MKFQLILLLLFIHSCGKIEEVKKKLADTSLNPVEEPFSGGTNSASFTPGSYFKVLEKVGTTQDTRVIEIQYLSDGRFLFVQTNFSSGTMSAGGFFQKKIGTYKEDKGMMVHTVTYDSCQNLSPQVVYFSGDRKDTVNVVISGTSQKFYSYMKYMLPSSVATYMDQVSEDLGCKKF